MKRVLVILVVCCLLLSGCGLFRDSYVSVTPHRNLSEDTENEVISVSNYAQLRAALVELVHNGTESSVINVSDYGGKLEESLESASAYVTQYDAIGAYAVESIEFEIGTSGVIPAVAVTISYLHGRTEIQQIQSVRNSAAMEEKIGNALERCNAGIVLLVENYTDIDIIQMVEDYAAEHPNMVMETPEVTCDIYPDNGDDRVVALKFTYQNSRNDLRQMQNQVQPIFNSAALYVSGSSLDYQKLSQLYAFLMERFGEYQIKTSITPAYSLLHHGVGDSRAFATVYAQMCRMAGLECQIVTGTRQGEPWSWNIVESDGYYYHADLLSSHMGNGFSLMIDDMMGEYVWDYSSYPACTGAPSEGEAEQPPAENGTENNPE